MEQSKPSSLDPVDVGDVDGNAHQRLSEDSGAEGWTEDAPARRATGAGPPTPRAPPSIGNMTDSELFQQCVDDEFYVSEMGDACVWFRFRDCSRLGTGYEGRVQYREGFLGLIKVVEKLSGRGLISVAIWLNVIWIVTLFRPLCVHGSVEQCWPSPDPWSLFWCCSHVHCHGSLARLLVRVSR